MPKGALLERNIMIDKISISGTVYDVEDARLQNAYSHNAIYRGKNISSLGVTEICNRIANGSFEDLYLGDYITLTTSYGTHDYILGGFDTKWRVYGLTQHHAIVFPRTNLTSAQMNTTNTTTGGYVGSAMFTTTLPSVASAIQSAFSNRVISHYDLLSTVINSSATNKNMMTGASSSWDWQSGRIVDLMSEIEVFGSQIFGNGFDNGTAKQRIPVFNFNPQLVITGQDYWLKDVASSTYFARCYYIGDANYRNASISCGVRPCFLIG